MINPHQHQHHLQMLQYLHQRWLNKNLLLKLNARSKAKAEAKVIAEPVVDTVVEPTVVETKPEPNNNIRCVQKKFQDDTWITLVAPFELEDLEYRVAARMQ